MLSEFALIDEHFPWFFTALSFIFGATVGSFLNVCIYRIPAEKSVVTPGSRCACGKPIAWYDNIPILSWILLRGKARCCGSPFSIRYPMIELLTAVLFLLCWVLFPPAKAFCGWIFVSILVCSTFIDLDHMIIPDRFTIGAAMLGLGLAFVFPSLHGQTEGLFLVDNLRSLILAAIGLLVGSATVLWIALVSEIVLRKETMGFGDVKFLGAIGAFTGWEGALFAIFGGAMIGTAGLLVFLILRPILPKNPNPEAGLFGRAVPFGPMLALGGLLYFLFLHGPVDAYFLENAEMLFGEFPP